MPSAVATPSDGARVIRAMVVERADGNFRSAVHHVFPKLVLSHADDGVRMHRARHRRIPGRTEHCDPSSMRRSNQAEDKDDGNQKLRWTFVNVRGSTDGDCQLLPRRAVHADIVVFSVTNFSGPLHQALQRTGPTLK